MHRLQTWNYIQPNYCQMLGLRFWSDFQPQNIKMWNLGDQHYWVSKQLYRGRKRNKVEFEQPNIKDKIRTEERVRVSGRYSIFLKNWGQVCEVLWSDSLLEHFERSLREMLELQRRHAPVWVGATQIQDERGGLLWHDIQPSLSW